MDKTRNERNYWKEEEELIIKQWADKAQCYLWMHTRCREKYQKKNAMFTIPVIIISTITGTANFAQDRFPENIKAYIVMSIGTLSIIAGIITTIYQFLQISELNEGHRVAVVSWTKFNNNLKTLVLRHPLDRMPVNEAIKIYQDEYDRLVEVSPNIDKKILANFNYKFKKNTDLIKPEICNTNGSTEVYKMTNEERRLMIDNLNKKPSDKKLVNTFFSLNGRNPSRGEIETMMESTNININSDSDSSSSFIQNETEI